MSHSTSSNSGKQPVPNQKAASSIVHKPFDTGTINIFNPFRSKSKSKSSSEPFSSKLVVNAVLEESNITQELQKLDGELNSTASKPRWFDRLLTPWTISAIAMLLLANIVSAVAIWRNPHRLMTSDELDSESTNIEALDTVGGSDLAQQEFVSLNLNNLSTISSSNVSSSNSVNSAQTVIKPEIAASSTIPLTQIDSKYHYIVTEYTGDRSLKLARKQVESVSLVNFPQGVFVYLGAFTEETAANEFVNQLKKAGVEAFVYPLD